MPIFHREGNFIISLSLIIIPVILVLNYILLPIILPFVAILLLVLLILILQFFRNPTRTVENVDNNLVYAPADGKVVVIEETTENEYFKDKRLQVSVFMSPLNVHVNRNGIGGLVKYYRYHPGKYLVAWHPKSSTENERTTVVIDNGKKEVLFRQIAGALAKRIINYLKEGQTVQQGSEMGFIRFGSRVDIFLPIDAKVKVSIGDVVKGNQTVIADIN